MKRILSLLLLTVLLLTTVSCSFGKTGSETTGATTAIIEEPTDPLDVGDAIARLSEKNVAIGRTDLVYDLTRDEVDRLLADFDELDRLLADATDYAAFDDLYTRLSEDGIDRIRTQTEIIYIFWCCDLSDAIRRQNRGGVPLPERTLFRPRRPRQPDVRNHLELRLPRRLL